MYYWISGPELQNTRLIHLTTIQHRAVYVIGDPKVIDGLEPFYRLYNAECSAEFFYLLPLSRLSHFSPKELEPIPISLMPGIFRPSDSFLPRTCKTWNLLLPEVFEVLCMTLGFLKSEWTANTITARYFDTRLHTRRLQSITFHWQQIHRLMEIL